MEVDSETWNNNVTDGAKFANLKAFVNAAREFEATHSESAINLMTRYLGLIASSCDLSIFSPGRSEVCAFFSALWRVMCDARGPHWGGVAVLSRASIEPNTRHALTHTYNWQESYLSELMKTLTTWILSPMTEPQHRVIGHKSLTVLVNVCNGNLPAFYALMRTVDMKDFVVHLISLKDGGYGGVEVCRLLVCLSKSTRGSGSTRQSEVHSYLCCTMRTLHKAIMDKDETQLLHAYTFLNDLCSDENHRNYVMTYPHFATALKESLQDIEMLCTIASNDMAEAETTSSCLRNLLKFLTVLMSLEEGRLPSELLSLLCEGLPTILVPPALEPGKSGLQWLQVVGALCEMGETQERVLQEVRKLLCAGLTSSNGSRRRQILQLVKHHYFPSDQMSQISDIATSSVMELYGYKITCMEQRLHSHTVALQNIESEMKAREHKAEERLKQAEAETRAIQKKLEQQNRLYQLNNQLEEMKRVQEMVAKLMSKSASTAAT
ncbi:unnamed protein product [Leptidea sinapis]|uniref:Uncharacterized protein n=1 Tax=Leptidea sinapis TaxID=189913 RepID=A0A5E4PMQ0_9NEOP|nr:unnamed protein product [Leptidea sinapis]